MSGSVLIAIPQVGLYWERSHFCLSSIKTSRIHEVLLIDNTQEGLSDHIRQTLERYRIHYVENRKNLGFSGSVNQAMKWAFYSGLRFLLMASSDTVFHPQAIDHLVSRILEGDVILVSPSDVRGQIPGPDQLIGLCVPIPRETPISNRDGYPTGMAAFIIEPTRFLSTIGYFDEGFSPAYYEDNDILYRIRLRGEKAIVYEPSMIYHHGRGTSEAIGVSDWSLQRDYYVKKWGGPPGSEIYRNPFNEPDKRENWVSQDDR